MTQHDDGPEFQIETTATTCAPGMSLRDWFAWQAIPAIVAATASGEHDPRRRHGGTIEQEMAVDAYLIADAMMEARE